MASAERDDLTAEAAAAVVRPPGWSEAADHVGGVGSMRTKSALALVATLIWLGTLIVAARTQTNTVAFMFVSNVFALAIGWLVQGYQIGRRNESLKEIRRSALRAVGTALCKVAHEMYWPLSREQWIPGGIVHDRCAPDPNPTVERTIKDQMDAVVQIAKLMKGQEIVPVEVIGRPDKVFAETLMNLLEGHLSEAFFAGLQERVQGAAPLEGIMVQVSSAQEAARAACAKAIAAFKEVRRGEGGDCHKFLNEQFPDALFKVRDYYSAVLVAWSKL